VLRYYSINLTKTEPTFGLSVGGAKMNLKGTGLYNSNIKKIKFSADGGERIVASDWNNDLKCLQCVMPPLSWISGKEEM